MFKVEVPNWTKTVPLNTFVSALTRNVKMSYFKNDICLYHVYDIFRTVLLTMFLVVGCNFNITTIQ